MDEYQELTRGPKKLWVHEGDGDADYNMST